MKLFVTVGTSSFDSLFKKIDEILDYKRDVEAIGQIGAGKYKPRNFRKIFKFTKNIRKYYEWADLIVAHGGAGTLYDILRFNKKAIVIPNRMAVEEHQIELVTELYRLGYIFKGDLERLPQQLDECLKYEFKPYKIESGWRIYSIIDKYIRSVIV
ncbi:MAG: hypothetical protein OdinLCB4_002295 [Candidatus Odinarchaeum yellowstonii]|jgi:beta-1,4-N-acetylglucosaminyltransferase|uniref:Glycosyl transferase family 28 C-terminal domain-containing protein n=1 Tax=Odinarchaeota yellowstonii (strain LCB_4) TaxID=1841599 RepID=A0AAF0D336_ODILC|nr:MAG: hypothetical protein OdinLCB4_002295 [Candidatus Odinarchaeum yellowstonii]